VELARELRTADPDALRWLAGTLAETLSIVQEVAANA
jgi:hypothetical protein